MCDEFRTDDLDVSVAAGEFTNTGRSVQPAIQQLQLAQEM